MAILGAGASLGEEAVLADSGREGEMSELFKHPAGVFSFCAHMQTIEVLTCRYSFSGAW